MCKAECYNKLHKYLFLFSSNRPAYQPTRPAPSTTCSTPTQAASVSHLPQPITGQSGGGASERVWMCAAAGKLDAGRQRRIGEQVFVLNTKSWSIYFMLFNYSIYNTHTNIMKVVCKWNFKRFSGQSFLLLSLILIVYSLLIKTWLHSNNGFKFSYVYRQVLIPLNYNPIQCESMSWYCAILLQKVKRFFCRINIHYCYKYYCHG